MAFRIILYSQDGLGLGHLRRTSALAGRLVAVYPGIDLVMLADSPRAGWFPIPPGARLVRLPGLVRLGPDVWRPGGVGSLTEVAAERRAAIESVLTSFPPDLLVVDHLPGGAMGELIPHLARLRSAGGLAVLGLRDVLDDPRVVTAQWECDGSFATISECYDQVLVYGQQDVFDLAAECQFPPAAATKVRYCGYLAAPASTPPPAPTPYRHVVAVVGGGADAHPVLSALLEAVPLIRASPVRATAVTGPFMGRLLRRDLQRRSVGLPVRVVASVSDAPSLLASADVVVSRAGYNATVEACRAKAPTVLVPRAGPSREQRLRATAFARRGWVEMVDPDFLSGPTLAGAIDAALADGPRARGGPDLGGLDRAVAHLADLVGAPT